MKQGYRWLIVTTMLMEPLLVRAAAEEAPQAADQPTREQYQEQLEYVTVLGREPLVDNTNLTLGAFGNKDAMEIPLSIQSYSAVLLENTRARTLLDVMNSDPGVQDGRINGSYSNLRIRGFSTDWTNTIRRDGLSLAPYQDVPLEGVGEVTVLKGPSGFLYGFNSPGGTVNFVTKRPTRDPFNQVTLEARSDDGWYAHVETSNTLGEKNTFGYRLNAGREDVGDFTENFNFERTFVAGSIDWVLSDAAVLQLNADYQTKAVASQPILGVGSGALPPMYDPTTLLGQPWLQYEADVYNIGVRLDYDLSSNWSVTAQAAVSENTRLAAFARVAGVTATGDILHDSGSRIDISPDQVYRTLSGQLFATGKFDSLGVAHEVVMGLSSVRYRALEAGYVRLSIDVGNIFDPVYVAKFDLPAAPAKTHNDVDQVSPFMSDMISFGERWQALIGARYIDFTNLVTAPAATPVRYQKYSIVPNYGLIFKPADGFMIYADYTRGLEQSGVAPAYAQNAGETLAPLVSKQYELGAKARIAGGVNVALAAFEITKTLEFVNDNLIFVQDGQQRHRGVELSANGILWQNLTLYGGVSRLFTELMDTNDASANGKSTQNAPDWQASLSFDYRIPAVRGLFLNGTVLYVDERAVNASNSIVAPGFTTLDLGARYVRSLFDRSVVFRLNVRNVADRRYWASAESSGVFPGAPRTGYFSVQVEF